MAPRRGARTQRNQQTGHDARRASQALHRSPPQVDQPILYETGRAGKHRVSPRHATLDLERHDRVRARRPCRSRSTPRPSPRPCTSARCTPRTASPIEHRRICPKHEEPTAIDYDDIVKGYEVSRGKWVELTDDEIAAAAGSRSKTDRRRPLRARRRTSRPSSSSGRTTSARRTRAGTPTRCCTRRSSSPAAPASAAGCSTTASARWSCGRSTTCSRCTRCASPTSSSTPATSTSAAYQRKPSEREIKMASSLVDGLHAEFDPERLRGQLPQGRPEGRQGQGRGQEHRAARRRGAREPPTTCWPPSRRAWRTPDAALALDRLAQLRARERPGRAVQRRARHRPALPPAPRQGPHAGGDPPLLRRGGRRRSRTRRSPTATRPTTAS